MVGLGTHTDWLEDKYKLSEGLDTLAQLVDSGVVAPVLDKVSSYLFTTNCLGDYSAF